MYDYLKGEIKRAEVNYVVIEVMGVGYLVYTPNPFVFKIGIEETIYLYSHIREDEYSLYGFKTLDERNLFLRLINVKGLGPKVALPILATGSINGIIDSIERENILYLTKFPKVGEKLARQIILDLKGKLVLSNQVDPVNDELVGVLESLGYKSADIKRVIKEVDSTLTIEEQVKQALKLLLK